MMKILCVKCQSEMKPVKNGTYVFEMAAAVKSEKNPQGIYKIWVADTWGCSNCDVEVVAGFGLKPVAIHHDEKFGEWLFSIKTEEGARIEYDYERPHPK